MHAEGRLWPAGYVGTTALARGVLRYVVYKNFVIALTMFFFGFWCRNVARCIRGQLSPARRTGFGCMHCRTRRGRGRRAFLQPARLRQVRLLRHGVLRGHDVHGCGRVPAAAHTAVLGSAHAYSRAGYNLILLFPIIGLGVIDQDVPAPAVLKFPQLYAVGQVGNGKPRPRSG